jgi:hypothetical protein
MLDGRVSFLAKSDAGKKMLKWTELAGIVKAEFANR